MESPQFQEIEITCTLTINGIMIYTSEFMFSTLYLLNQFALVTGPHIKVVSAAFRCMVSETSNHLYTECGCLYMPIHGFNLYHQKLSALATFFNWMTSCLTYRQCLPKIKHALNI